MDKVYIVMVEEKTFYFTNGTVSSIDNNHILDKRIFTTKKEANDFAMSSVSSIIKNHVGKHYESQDDNHAYVALLDERNRMKSSFNFKVQELFIHIDRCNPS